MAPRRRSRRCRDPGTTGWCRRTRSWLDHSAQSRFCNGSQLGLRLGYAEPVSAFLQTATLFSETLQNLDVEVGSDDDKEVGWAEHRRTEAHRALFSFLAGCTPALADEPTDGGHTRAFHSKSLLASLAMMAYLDLTSDKRVLRCDEDGRPFVSGAYQARYCSDRCRNRALKRAFHERHREREVAGDAERTSA